MSLPVIRGGQTLFHSIHMFAQVCLYLLLGTIITFITVFLASFYYSTEQPERYLSRKWIEASIISTLNPKGKIIKPFENNKIESFPVNDFLKLTQSKQKILLKKCQKASLNGGVASITVALLLLFWFKQRGKRLGQVKVISGRYLADKKTMIKVMKKSGELSDLKIADIPIFKGSESQHILVHGSSGTGKSVTITDLLMQIKKRGDRIIIYDKHGTYLSQFYDDNKDIILNPMDTRCAIWHPWAECETQADFEQFAASLIPTPKSNSDPFWINSARSLLAAIAYNMKDDDDRSLRKLLQVLFSSDLSLVKKYVAGTEAESLMSEEIQKTALSIKSVLANYIKPLRYLEDEKEAFSIRKWVSEENNKWLFITSVAQYHEAIKPLISAWLDIAANQLIGLNPDPNRRLWIILDELASLQKLNCLQDALAESRKFGGCIVLGLQNVFQLHDHYGADGTKAMMDLCNTKVFFRAPSYQCAEWVSKEIGMQEVIESREGISYGAHHVRDGVSMQEQISLKPVLTVTELMSFPNLTLVISLQNIKIIKNKSMIAKCELQLNSKKKIISPLYNANLKNRIVNKSQYVFYPDPETDLKSKILVDLKIEL